MSMYQTTPSLSPGVKKYQVCFYRKEEEIAFKRPGEKYQEGFILENKLISNTNWSPICSVLKTKTSGEDGPYKGSINVFHGGFLPILLHCLASAAQPRVCSLRCGNGMSELQGTVALNTKYLYPKVVLGTISPCLRQSSGKNWSTAVLFVWFHLSSFEERTMRGTLFFFFGLWKDKAKY